MKINILGSQWNIEHVLEQELADKNCDGFADNTVKKIVVATFEAGVSRKEDLKWHTRKVLRHEIIHAFLYESGLGENSDWAFNEEMVDWMAFQIPKLLAAFEAAGAMD